MLPKQKPSVKNMIQQVGIPIYSGLNLNWYGVASLSFKEERFL
ncbi:hypothetical protein [Neisseria meningitidis]|nr:hypothetical protein [Neisseria meningitidis]